MIKLLISCSLISVLVLGGCSRQSRMMEGYVNFGLESQLEITDQTKSNVSDYTTLPSKESFNLKITGPNPSEVLYSGLLSGWDASTPVPVGNYTAQVSYGSLEEEGFDKPCFSGKTKFAVTGGQTSNVNVPAELQNTIIKISYSELFKSYFKDYSFKLTRDNSDIVTFSKDETKGAFVDGYKISLVGSLTTQGDKAVSFSKDYSNLDSATAYTIGLDVTGVNNVAIEITFNDQVEEVPLGDVELND